MQDREAVERAAEARVVAWLRGTVAAETISMMLAAGLPGGTRTQRVKAAAHAEGCAHAVSMIADAIARREHLGGDGE